MSLKEPSLAVRPRPAPFFLRRQFLRPFAPVASLTVVGLVALLVFANLLLPFKRLVTLDGAMGTYVSFFNDEQVRELLLRHHMQVHVTRKGSREIANINLDAFDFVFPSGQPAANQITQRQPSAGRYRPFVSHIVLATYRGYAETLRDAGAATPQNASGFDRPYYYTLDMDRFLNLIHAQKSWNDVKAARMVSPTATRSSRRPQICARPMALRPTLAWSPSPPTTKRPPPRTRPSPSPPRSSRCSTKGYPRTHRSDTSFRKGREGKGREGKGRETRRSS